MKQLLMILLNVFGIICFLFGLLSLGFYDGPTTSYKLFLIWGLYLVIPSIVIAIDCKYLDRVFGKSLYLKK